MHTKNKMILIMFFLILFSGSQISCSRDETKSIELELNENALNNGNALNNEDESNNIESSEIKSNADNSASTSKSIFVYVCGAVMQEGVYELPSGSRVYEAIEKAGGLRADAATSQINQAEILEDEMQLYIPTKYEAQQQLIQEAEEADGKVNINSAAKEELMTLPGVGEAKADSIIKYREANGPFQTIEDIMQISGIKNGLFEKIKDYIKV